MRQPRSDRSPGLDPLFDRCSASGAPQSLHTKPTHDWLSVDSAAFFVAVVLFVEELLSTSQYAPFSPLEVYPIAHRDRQVAPRELRGGGISGVAGA